MKAFRCLFIVVVMTSLCLVASAGVLAGPPGLPSVFYGAIDTMADVEGARLVAMVDGTEYASTSVLIDGSLGPVYLLNVVADDPETVAVEGGQAGDSVRFVLELDGGRRLDVVQTGVWSAGSADELDLSPYSYLLLPLVTFAD